ncbi:NTP transferase domain-containing protein [Candidatus Woesearchaeota archaeon]|nr:NTP transferase domain-containing protein [Candidatus Woesearchaeota archaeon]
MKVVILCGGKGTRLKELTEELPKPLVEIGDKPIIWHIMKTYSHYGYKDFILCLGYKGHMIRDYFNRNEENWNIEFIDTGKESNKGQRIKAIENYIEEENFFVAYGDDVADINIKELLQYHVRKNKIVTLTAVNPVSQFGIIELNSRNEIIEFKEKPKLDHCINGGFFIFNRKIFNFIKKGYDLEKQTFEDLVKINQICAYKHKGFWKCMNTFKDTMELNELWDKKRAPWVLW